MAQNNFLWKRRNLDWILLMLLSLVFFFSALREWKTTQESFPWDSQSLFTLFTVFFSMLAFGTLFQRYGLKRSWDQVFRFTGPLDPKDEREWLIHSRATEYTFGMTYALLFLLAMLFLVLPSPSPVALFNVLLFLLTFLIALRGFFAWLLGIR